MTDPKLLSDIWRAKTMTESKRPRDMTWRERGAHDFAQGVEREPGPFPAGEPEGADWRDGWDGAEGAAPEDGDTVFRVAPVYRIERDSRFYVVDAQGRLLGNQIYINMEQQDQGPPNVTVTLAGVALFQGRP